MYLILQAPILLVTIIIEMENFSSFRCNRSGTAFQELNPVNKACKMADTIIQQCESIPLGTQTKINSFMCGETSTRTNFKKTANLPSYVLDPSQPNPQEQVLTDKYVNKLKSKYKKNRKPPNIRKCDLGENHLIFTEAEELKLQIVDEFLQKGFQLPKNIFGLQLYTQSQNKTPEELNSSAIDALKLTWNEAQNKNDINEFDNWGEEGNKITVLKLANQHNKQIIKKLDLNKLKTGQLKKRECKIVNFKNNSKVEENESSTNKLRTSLRMYKPKKNLRSALNHMKSATPVIISQFDTEKYMDHVNFNTFAPIKSSPTEKFNRNHFKNMNRREKMSKLTQYLKQKYVKTIPSCYMTPTRIQAMYECEMIKGAKDIMDKKQYSDLCLVRVSEDDKLEDFPSKQFYFSDLSLPNREAKDEEKEKYDEQIDKILDKNRKRLKNQRQRIIQKLRF